MTPAARTLPAARAPCAGHAAGAAQATAVATCQGEGRVRCGCKARHRPAVQGPDGTGASCTDRCAAARLHHTALAGWDCTFADSRHCSVTGHALPHAHGKYLQRVSAAPRSPRLAPAWLVTRLARATGGMGSCRTRANLAEQSRGGERDQEKGCRSRVALPASIRAARHDPPGLGITPSPRAPQTGPAGHGRGGGSTAPARRPLPGLELPCSWGGQVPPATGFSPARGTAPETAGHIAAMTTGHGPCDAYPHTSGDTWGCCWGLHAPVQGV